jgi:PKD repeat protein/V8-like Glu-specific endopeptidase
MVKINAFLLSCFFLTMFFSNSVVSQVQTPGVPPSFKKGTFAKSQANIPEFKLKKINIRKLLKEDKEFPAPLRYAIHESVDIDIKKTDLVIENELGKIYQYKLVSEGALSINIFFKNYHVPEDAELYLYNPKRDVIYGAFTSLNNKSFGRLAIADFPSEEVILEYFEPHQAAFEGEVVIGSVGKAYRNIDDILSDYVITQQSFKVDVNCPVGDEYQLEKHAVCRMTFKEGRGSFVCTGALINNTKFNGIPYFLTANHCISSDTVAQTLVTYFNYERAQCDDNTVVSLNKTISGASLKASASPSDFTLLELSKIPDESFKPYYAGWNIADTAPGNSYSIHHPGGQVKEIAIDLDSAISYPFQINWKDQGGVSPPNSHWQVSFDVGGTEGGSSGSPLFDGNNKIVGQLHGGDTSIDYYGKLSRSWNGVVKSRALKFWLDPDDTGVSEIEGYTPNGIKPDVHISSNLDNACLAAPVKFFDKSAFTPDNWNWSVNSHSAQFVNGTNANSQNPEISFSSPGQYNISLTASNEYGTTKQTFNSFINVSKEIDVSYIISSDKRVCYDELINYEIIAHGAENFQWTILPDTLLTYVDMHENNEQLVISKNENSSIDSTVEAYVVSIGSHGWCTDAVIINLSLVEPYNDLIQNAQELQFGINGPFSNKCAGIQENEPVPPFGDCNTQLSWCDEYGTGENIVEKSIWYTFTGPSSGVVSIETRGFDNQIAVYEADRYQDIISGNNQLYEVIAANDDYNSDDYSATIEQISVTPGKKYWVQVDGSGGGKAGIFTIKMKASPLTANAVHMSLTGNLSIYPNPASDEVYIDFSKDVIDINEPVSVNITALDGKTVYSQLLNNLREKVKVDVKNLESGIYFIRVYNEQKYFIGKLVVE